MSHRLHREVFINIRKPRKQSGTYNYHNKYKMDHCWLVLCLQTGRYLCGSTTDHPHWKIDHQICVGKYIFTNPFTLLICRVHWHLLIPTVLELLTLNFSLCIAFYVYYLKQSVFCPASFYSYYGGDILFLTLLRSQL